MRPWVLATLLACAGEPTTSEATTGGATTAGGGTMRMLSEAFGPGEPIPARYTCEGGDTSPPLRWADVPTATKSLALTVTDPDAPDPAAPKRTWVHWVVYDLPGDTAGLAEGAAASLPAGAHDGSNDWKRTGYGGPCPPIGRHRYVFRLYALDVLLGDQGALTEAELRKRIDGHVLASTELVGTYQKAGK